MNSLRFRLVLGFSLVAVVPLAIAMLVLSQRIQATVRDQASHRLAAALDGIEGGLRTEGERALDKLDILARDATLRRLVLVQPVDGRELSEYLAEKRFLLGLDVLVVADTAGGVIADAASAPSVLARSDREAIHLAAPAGTPANRLDVLAVTGAPARAMVAGVPIRYQNDVVAMLRGGIVLDDSLLARLGRTSGLELVLREAQGQPVASTLGSPAAMTAVADHPDGAVAVPGRGSHLARTITLNVGGEPRLRLTGLVSTATADRAIAALRTTSIVFGALGLIAAIALGVLWSLAVSRPVERIARFSERVAHGSWDEPLALRGVRELETLAAALDRMRLDLRGYRDRLVSSERHAAWSLMARAVAHEVRNPLTPIAVSVADLKRSYEQQRADFPQVLEQAVRTIGDEIESLKRMLHEFSELGRFPEPQLAACRVGDVVSDLETLYSGDVADGRLKFGGASTGAVVRADRGQLRQALVNLIKNALEATDHAGRVEVTTRVDGPDVEIAVADSGPGLTAEQRAQLFVPHFTTKQHGTGLGLTIVHRIVNDHGGTIAADPGEGRRGTTFRIRLPLARKE